MNPSSSLFLKPGTLLDRLGETTQRAIESGALKSIPTNYEFIEDNGIKFIVRILANLVSKEKKQRQDLAQKVNPFLPYEQALFVSHLSPTHVCLLNKFNVVDRHLLMITRDFQSQQNWLNLQDFQALWLCLREIDGLGFYNGGEAAGASQPHKHLQLVPLDPIADNVSLPITTLILNSSLPEKLGKIKQFSFQHSLIHYNLEPHLPTPEASQTLYSAYQTLIHTLGWKIEGDTAWGDYNLLVTRQWMLIVPRSQASFGSISVNSLGFAGTFFVRDLALMEFLKTVGPLTLLEKVGQVGAGRSPLPSELI